MASNGVSGQSYQEVAISLSGLGDHSGLTHGVPAPFSEQPADLDSPLLICAECGADLGEKKSHSCSETAHNDFSEEDAVDAKCPVCGETFSVDKSDPELPLHKAKSPEIGVHCSGSPSIVKCTECPSTFKVSESDPEVPFHTTVAENGRKTTCPGSPKVVCTECGEPFLKSPSVSEVPFHEAQTGEPCPGSPGFHVAKQLRKGIPTGDKVNALTEAGKDVVSTAVGKVLPTTTKGLNKLVRRPKKDSKKPKKTKKKSKKGGKKNK